MPLMQVLSETGRLSVLTKACIHTSRRSVLHEGEDPAQKTRERGGDGSVANLITESQIKSRIISRLYRVGGGRERSCRALTGQ